MRSLIRKVSTMRSKFLIIALGSALAGCQTAPGHDNPARGFAAVNVPVVTSADYVALWPPVKANASMAGSRVWALATATPSMSMAMGPPLVPRSV
jgi:hypothetical protein